MVKGFVKAAVAMAGVVAFGASQAAADTICLFGFCFDLPPIFQPSPSTPHAPEIDASQGLAALAIVACALLIAREWSVRRAQRA